MGTICPGRRFDFVKRSQRLLKFYQRRHAKYKHLKPNAVSQGLVNSAACARREEDFGGAALADAVRRSWNFFS